MCRGKTVVSNATRWDTFEKMLGEDKLPQSGGWVETV
jgi:prolycopene isomerase